MHDALGLHEQPWWPEGATAAFRASVEESANTRRGGRQATAGRRPVHHDRKSEGGGDALKSSKERE